MRIVEITKRQRQEYIDVLQKCLDTKWRDPKYPKFMGFVDECAACDSYHIPSGCWGCPIEIALSGACIHTPVARERNNPRASSLSRLTKTEWDEMVQDERLFLQALIDHLKTGYELWKFQQMTDYDWSKDA